MVNEHEDTVGVAEPDPVHNPILNSPWEGPKKHWPLDHRYRIYEDAKPVPGRRLSGSDLPVPQPVESDDQSHEDRSTYEPHDRIECLRQAVGRWRDLHWPGINRKTRELLEHWSDQDASKQPLWCQLEAVETIIWLKEAKDAGSAKERAEILSEIKRRNDQFNDGIERLAIKMATGTGKTWVMAMLILWHAMTRKEGETADVLIIVPNLTIKDRLRTLSTEGVALKNAGPRHAEEDLLGDLMPGDAGRPANLKVTVRNYHAFESRKGIYGIGSPDEHAQRRERDLLKRGPNDQPDPILDETEEQTFDRVLPDHRGRGQLLVLNDEAHHCYRMEGEGRDHEGWWYRILKRLQALDRLGGVIDLSATPAWRKQPTVSTAGDQDRPLKTELFPWIVSDTPLLEAVEAGIVKIPQLPVKDDTNNPEMPFYRNTYKALEGAPLIAGKFPSALHRLLDAMHEDLGKFAKLYEPQGKLPVLIIVTGTIDDAEECYRELAGELISEGGGAHEVYRPGRYPTFSNVDEDKHSPRLTPRTYIIHSRLDDASTGSEVERSAKVQQAFFPKKEKESNADYLKRIREVRNTVGIAGGLGEQARCIISVGMLTEGWDAKTVTHVVGYRAFKSDLLCEQIAGRSLRRTSMPVRGEPPVAEYARITGIPFRFMLGEPGEPPPVRPSYEVQTVAGRQKLRIPFVKIIDYSLDHPGPRVTLDEVKAREPYDLSNARMPTVTILEGGIGNPVTINTPSGIKRVRAEIYKIAQRTISQFSENNAQDPRMATVRKLSMFASILQAVERWLELQEVVGERLIRTFFSPHDEEIPRRIALACSIQDGGLAKVLPVFRPGVPKATDTRERKFRTTLQDRFPNNAPEGGATKKSELSAAACHSKAEAKFAALLDKDPRVEAWVRNYRLDWYIPYHDRKTGHKRRYEPDFVVRTRTKDGSIRLIVVEIKGVEDLDSERKKETAEKWWVPAANAADIPGIEGRWEYIQIKAKLNMGPQLKLVLQPRT